jgi:hypothetical protein
VRGTTASTAARNVSIEDGSGIPAAIEPRRPRRQRRDQVGENQRAGDEEADRAQSNHGFGHHADLFGEARPEPTADRDAGWDTNDEGNHRQDRRLPCDRGAELSALEPHRLEDGKIGPPPAHTRRDRVSERGRRDESEDRSEQERQVLDAPEVHEIGRLCRRIVR